MGYLASPLWMAQLLVGIVLVLQSQIHPAGIFHRRFLAVPGLAAIRLRARVAPVRIDHRASCSRRRFLGRSSPCSTARPGAAAAARSGSSLSTLLEILISAALAPIMMLIQSGAVLQILSGRDTGWNPQRRDDGSIPFPASCAAIAPTPRSGSSPCSPPA